MSRILYVEDNDDNAFMLKMRFDLDGDHEVVIATNGRQGLGLAHAEQPDLILMDIDLPDMSGLDAVSRLRRDPATSGIPIIAVTAHAMAGDREKALAAGCDEFDTKPVDFERLSHKIKALLRG
jgi:CheY-like chemotaxis protein